MRDLFKKILIGIAICITPQVLAEEYKVLIIPDNIVTESIAVDSYIYNASAEFFADDIITNLNKTDLIKAPSVSEIREFYKKDVSSMLAAKNLTYKFRTTYNIDYSVLKKLANKSDSRYVLLITSFVDAENYVLRRTLWDFLNIPGATVVDPAYKITTYAVLVDTENNAKLWAETYGKTISVCENRIITRGASPQVEQLRKIKDYSKYMSLQVAQKVQENVLGPEILVKESTRIKYGIGDVDNEFTKKYRHLGRETNKVYKHTKKEFKEASDERKARKNKKKSEKEIKKKMDSKLEVNATPIYENTESSNTNINNISNTVKEQPETINNAVYEYESNEISYPELINIEIKKKKKNKKSLYSDFETNRPDLRNYN